MGERYREGRSCHGPKDVKRDHYFGLPSAPAPPATHRPTHTASTPTQHAHTHTHTRSTHIAVVPSCREATQGKDEIKEPRERGTRMTRCASEIVGSEEITLNASKGSWANFKGRTLEEGGERSSRH